MMPTSRLIGILLLWFCLAVAAAFLPALLIAWIAIGGLILAGSAYDSWHVTQQRIPHVSRHLEHTIPIGEWRSVTVTVRNTCSWPVDIQLYDHFPSKCSIQHLPFILTIAASSGIETHYQIRFDSRGEFVFSGLDLLLQSRWKLFARKVFITLPLTIRVYPNFASIAKYGVLAPDSYKKQLGAHVRNYRGQGFEFHQLRHYQQGDVLRQIDWKATSRLRKLIAREHQAESDQHIFFALDCGQRMRAKEGTLSHFDEALNAMLLLANVALQQGDAVGCMSFGHETRVVPMQKGNHVLTNIMEQFFDLEPSLNAPDYEEAALQIATVLHKRSLIILLTNLRDEDHQALTAAVHILRKRHVVVIASLKEASIENLSNINIKQFEDALTFAAAHHYLNHRHHILETLRSYGTHILDVSPSALPLSLIQYYLRIKQSRML
ncbi:MAG: DUF58 domain-containing protein [Pseudomonadota bacterium]